MNRREHLRHLGAAATALSGVGALLPGAALGNSADMPAAADRSRLIYITPLKADTSESRCQAEVWFLRQGDDLLVVTQADAWRARAITQGRVLAKIWVGDVGVWSRNPEYRDLPWILAKGAMITDPAAHTAMLEKFGGKYRDEWPVWGPRWAEGLADGSRVMIRYRLA